MNENLKNILTSGLVALVVVALGFAIYSPGTSTITERIKEQFGALTGPDIPYNYIGVGGERIHRFGATFVATSTSLCVFAPDFGTTTIRSISVGINVSTSTASVITFAKATNDTSASTTVLWTAALGANTKGFIDVVATSTGGLIDTAFTLGPNDTLNISISGPVAGTEGVAIGSGLGDYLLNTCSASFLVH